MKSIKQPKKQPEIIRKAILNEAMILAARTGVSGISIQAIADAVGITKGGVFHHFKNKNILIMAMMNESINQVDKWVEAILSKESDHYYGQFTRAYIAIVLMITGKNGTRFIWSALLMTIITDNSFSYLWQQWLCKKLEQYRTTDSYYELELIRLAVDGIWLKIITGCLHEKSDFVSKTIRDLFKRTRAY